MNVEEIVAAVRAFRDHPLYRQTIVCPPGAERAVIDSCPDGVAVRSSRLVPGGTVYVIDNDRMDDLLNQPYAFTYRRGVR